MDLNEIKKRMHTGEVYLSGDETLIAEQLECLEKLYDYNQTRPNEQQKRQELLKEMFAEIGEDCYIEPPLRTNFGGKHVHFGNHVYANFNLTLVDDTHIYVGDNVMFAPNVLVCTATHPISPELRAQGAQYNLPITIGNDVWIGSGSTILPGVTIGENSVIGAGSLVTHDIPANVVAYGTPCKVMREFTKEEIEEKMKP